MKKKKLIALLLCMTLVAGTLPGMGAKASGVSLAAMVEQEEAQFSDETKITAKEYVVTEDAFVRQGRADTNYNSDPFSKDHGSEYVGGNYRALTMKKVSGDEMMGVMKLTLPSPEDLADYDRYEFVFHVLRNPKFDQGDQTFRFCYTTDTDWTESTITWNNKPQTIASGSENILFDFEISNGTDYQTMIKNDPTAGDMSFDITDKVKELVSAGIEEITVFTYGVNTHPTFLQISERSCKLADAGAANPDQAVKIVATSTQTALERLNAYIADCETVSEEGYTRASFQLFADKLAEAKNFAAANPTDENAVRTMYITLMNTRMALAQETAYEIIEDAFIRSDRAANTGDSETLGSAHGVEYVGKNCRALNVKKYSGGADIMSVMKFPLPSTEEIAAGKFNEYELVFHVIRNPGFDKGDQTYRFCYTTDTQWQESTITWNTKPASIVRDSENVLFDFEVKQGTDYQTMIKNGESTGEVRFDITDMVTALTEEGKSEVTVFAYGITPIETSLQFHERSSLLASASTNNSDVAAKIVAREAEYTLEKLTELINVCKVLESDDYTEESFTALTEELKAAEEFAAENPTDTVLIRVRYKALEAVKNALVKMEDPNDPDNIAYLRPTRSNLSNQETYKVTDGDQATYWSGRFYPAYVDIDLMDTYDISEIMLNFPENKAIYYTLYGSNDGKNYDEIYKNHSDEKKTEAADTVALENCSYRIVRVYIEYTDTNNASYLSEIKVHGTKTNTNTEELRKGSFEEITGIKAYSETDYAKPVTVEETIENVYGIVDRTVGSNYRKWFKFEIAPNTENDNDYFELSDSDGKILIRGNEGLSLTSGLNYYYKNYVNVHISEQTMQAAMPESIVPINGTVRKETDMKVRYAYNYCTLSYTFAFFGEEEWQRENDWLALNGVNVVLDLAGQEATWIKFLMNYNYSYDEAKDWLVGPGYYAWQYMQNMDQFGGPIPDGYVIDRVELARSTQRWKNSLGMQTVLQGYAGMVPNTFKEYNPEIAIIDQPGWGGFARPDMIATDSELYDQMAEKFYEAEEFIYGATSDYYAVDPFHEGGKRPEGLTDDAIAEQVLESLLKYDDKAVWVVQAWQSNPTNALLKGMAEHKEEHCLIVDLIKYPLESWLNYKRTDYTNPRLESVEFNNTNWAWCLLGNFGGNPTMNSQLETMVKSIQEARKESKHMVGLGIISEATYDNPMVYDLIFDLAWADESFDLDRWMDRYIERRYGGITDNAKLAWDYIKESNYSQGVRNTQELFGLRTGGKPENIGKKNIGYDTAKLENALRLLVNDFDKFKGSEAYLYDLTEIMRQVVSNYTVMKNNELIDAKNAKNLEKFVELKAEFLNAFDVLNEVAGTQKEQLGGEWIGKAQDRASDYDDFTKSTFEMNAKSLITTWGNGTGGLIDYAFRTYEGIFSDLIKSNWVAYLDQVEENLRTGKSISNPDYRVKYWKWVVGEQVYTRDAKDSPEEVLVVAKKILEQCVFTGELDPNIGNIALNKPVTANGVTAGKAEILTDGKTDALFTIEGTNGNCPEIIIDLFGYFDISKMQFVLDAAEQSAYQIYVSADNETWELFDEKAAGEEKDVFEDSSKTGRYVKIAGADTSALTFGEVRVYGDRAAPDLEQLKALVNTAEELNVSGNPQDKIVRFQNALAAAKEGIKNDINPDNLNNVYWELYDAIADLNLSGVYNIVLKKSTKAHNDPSGYSERLVDGKPETNWNSGRLSPPGKPYETTITPGWTIIDLDGLFKVSSANVMLQRSDIWYQYEIWSSLDGENWTKLGEKKTENLPNEKEDTYTFETEPYARYIKLQTTNIQVDPNYNNGNNGRYNYNVNEPQVFGSPVILDKAVLEALIAEAEGKTEADYTEESWKAMQEALTEAKKVLTDMASDQEALDNAAEVLNEAIAGLTMKPVEKTEYTVTVDGEVVKTGTYNTKVVLTAEPRESKTFVGWMVDGKMVSSDEEYVFYLANDIELTKVYADRAEAAEIKPEAVLSSVLAMDHAADPNKVNARFVGQLVLPDDCKILEAGLVWASNDTAVLDVEHAKVTRINKISDTNQFSVTINGLPQGRFVRGRVFATIQIGDQKPQTIYSVTGKITNTK